MRDTYWFSPRFGRKGSSTVDPWRHLPFPVLLCLPSFSPCSKPQHTQRSQRLLVVLSSLRHLQSFNPLENGRVRDGGNERGDKEPSLCPVCVWRSQNTGSRRLRGEKKWTSGSLLSRRSTLHRRREEEEEEGCVCALQNKAGTMQVECVGDNNKKKVWFVFIYFFVLCEMATVEEGCTEWKDCLWLAGTSEL